MIAIITLLVVIVVSVLVTRVATVALTLTGLSRQSARFQARSAFTGVGFTTSESENVVNHPVRRRILMILMMLGNAGLVTAISTLIVSMVRVESTVGLGLRVGVLVLGLVLLWSAASSPWVDRWISRIVGRLLARSGQVVVRDYAHLLHIGGEWGIHELHVEASDWIAGKTLRETRLADEGVLVLGLSRADGTFVGAPRGETRIRADDNMVLYGRAAVLAELDTRSRDWSGEKAHYAAVEEQVAVEQLEAEREAVRERQDPVDVGS